MHEKKWVQKCFNLSNYEVVLEKHLLQKKISFKTMILFVDKSLYVNFSRINYSSMWAQNVTLFYAHKLIFSGKKTANFHRDWINRNVYSTERRAANYVNAKVFFLKLRKIFTSQTTAKSGIKVMQMTKLS